MRGTLPCPRQLGMLLALALAGLLTCAVNRAFGQSGTIWGGELTRDTTFSPSGNPHLVVRELVVPSGITLTIEPGVEVRFAPGVALRVYGRLLAEGTPTATIRFTRRDPGTYWSRIVIVNSQADNRLGYAELEYMEGFYAQNSRIHLHHNTFHDLRRDALVSDGGMAIIQSNHIYNVSCSDACEGIQIRNVPHHLRPLVIDNHVHHIKDDCLDINSSYVIVLRNRLHHCGDKGISVGPPHQHTLALRPTALSATPPASATIINTLVYSSAIGIAVKDGSFARIVHTTLVGNREGLLLDESLDRPGAGGGSARVINTIIWGGKYPVRLDLQARPPSTVTITHSDVQGGWPGKGNLNVAPAFVGPEDFHLRPDSPLVDAGEDTEVTTDLDGNPRPRWGAPDIGAYEAQSPFLRLTARAGNRSIRLNWEVAGHNTALASFAISTTVEQGAATAILPGLITGIPTTTRAYTLTDLTNGVWYTVSVEARDAQENVLERSNYVAVRPTEGCTVYLPLVSAQRPPPPPLYSLTIDPAHLAWLYANFRADETVPAIFTYEGTSYEVAVRFRGDTARYHRKKSWKIRFPAATPFQGQRELNLNAEFPDRSLLREMLAYDLFRRVGLPAPRTQFVRLEINGEYKGVYVQVEQIDQRFLERIGWDPNGNLYKGDYGSNFDWVGEGVTAYVKKTNREDSNADILDLLRVVNFTSDAAFPAALADRMDVGRYLDWYAVQIVLGNYEWVEKNYYLYHDLKEDWWAFIPWDLDLTLGHNWGANGVLDRDISWDNPIDSGTVTSPKADGKWNKLITRVLRNEAFRFAYCRRLRALLEEEFTEAALFPLIDALHSYIAPYAEADTLKWGSNEDFRNGPAELKTYITNRRGWLKAQIPVYCPARGPLPVLNELMPYTSTVLADEFGEYEPWIELHNPGLVSFDVGGMRLRVIQPESGVQSEWALPSDTIIPPGGFLLIWADGEPAEGPLHTSFRLELGCGGAGLTSAIVALLDKPVHGGSVVEERALSPGVLCHPPGQSIGRQPDGATSWVIFAPPYATPGWSNRGRAPVITGVAHTPPEPLAGWPVTVTALVHDPDVYDVVTRPRVLLHWAVNGVPQPVLVMHDDGTRGDGEPGDGLYGATLPPLGNGAVVTYYLHTQDAGGLASVAPPRAPRQAYRYVAGFQRPSLRLNELLAINQNVLADEAGEYDDWFEIHNFGTSAADVGGMYLTDAIENTTKWRIPAGLTIPPGGRLVLWADGQPGQGPLHTNFKLDGDGGRLALYAGRELVDEVYYGPQTVDRPWGRYPDSCGGWRPVLPTPGGPNQQPPPVVGDLQHGPAAPAAAQSVLVTARIVDEGTVLSATLYYAVTLPSSPVTVTEFLSVPMRSAGEHLYAAVLPPQPDGVAVSYYVQAEDELGGVAIHPRAAPTVTYGYSVGYRPPPLVINEFLAANRTVNADERGEYDDWIELYNAGKEPLDIGGMYLTDDLGRPNKWRIPDGTVVPAGGFVLIWADDDEEQGPLHTSFKLERLGEEIGLFTLALPAPSYLPVDRMVYGPQLTDVSWGRVPDGGALWRALAPPTPGTNNR
ncbi:MAG: CotH kinase family protein [Anaerolineae bacterium]|nr:CotH kinase family protein [Anaerolineae bacterium]